MAVDDHQGIYIYIYIYKYIYINIYIYIYIYDHQGGKGLQVSQGDIVRMPAGPKNPAGNGKDYMYIDNICICM
jgi:hypothetical protein